MNQWKDVEKNAEELRRGAEWREEWAGEEMEGGQEGEGEGAGVGTAKLEKEKEQKVEKEKGVVKEVEGKEEDEKEKKEQARKYNQIGFSTYFIEKSKRAHIVVYINNWEKGIYVSLSWCSECVCEICVQVCICT